MNAHGNGTSFWKMATPAAPDFPGWGSAAGCFAAVCLVMQFAWDGPAMAQADFVRETGVGQAPGSLVEKVGDRFLVNTTTSGDQGEADVVLAYDGMFYVAWKGWDQESIHGQLFDWDANPVGDEILFAESDSESPILVRGLPMEEDPPGEQPHPTLLWGEYDILGGGDDPHLNARSTEPGASVVQTTFYHRYTAPAAAPSRGGYRVVVRNQEDTALKVQRRDVHSALVVEFEIETPAPTFTSVVDNISSVRIPELRPPGLQANTESGVIPAGPGPAAGPAPVSGLVSYIWEDTSNGLVDVVSGRFYDEDDNPVGGEFQINDPAEASIKGSLSTAANASGLVMAVWRSGSTSPNIVMRLIDAEGPIPGWHIVGDEQVSGLRFPDVAAAGERFLVTWERSVTGSPNTWDIRARLIDVSDPWAPVGGTEIAISDSGRHPAIAADAEGRAVVVWEDDDGDQDGIYAQRLQLLPDRVFLDRFEEAE